jgi:adenylate cyclase
MADVVGYSRLIEADEAGTLAAVKERRSAVIEPLVSEHSGRIVKVMGDGVLVEFASAVNAVSCALAIQARMGSLNDSQPEDKRIQFRIGINLGDVIGDGSDIYGEGVIIAARLEPLAESGGICLSGSVHESIGSSLGQQFVDGGLHEVKNITRAVRIWRWPGGVAAGQTASQPPAMPDKPSIAVLPFDNMSGDPEQEYLADGVVESITAALSRIRAFFVIARNSAFAYKGRPKNVREIGRELGVAYVLEGSVQRGGSRVRITVQLIETAGGAHLWADRFDGTLDDIFDLQDRIAEHVAGALQPSIRIAEVERAQRKRPQDLGAYGYTMRAMRHVWVLEKEEAARALELLGQALAIDPDYPLALALAAWCWAQRSVYTWVSDTAAARAEALRLADRAANQSADDPLILSVLGAVHTFARHYGAARVMLERALALDPNSAWAHSRLGWLDVYASRPEEAKVHFERAIRLSPLDPINFNNYVGLASARQVVGDDGGAADLFIRALQERPNAKWIHRNLAAALQGAGRTEEARQSRDALLEAYPDMSIRRFKEAMVFSPDVLERIAGQLRALGLPEE